MLASTAFNQDISGWNTGAVTNMSGMFNGTASFNQDISGWNTSSLTNMYVMFHNATAFNQDIGAWDVDLVTNFAEMISNSGLSYTNYDNLLIGWEAQSLQSGRTLGATNIEYCNATTERGNIIGSFSWTINDNGQDPACQPQPFIISVKTDNAGTSNSTSFTIPTTGAGYNYDVDCDNNGVYEVTGQTGAYTCSY